MKQEKYHFAEVELGDEYVKVRVIYDDGDAHLVDDADHYRLLAAWGERELKYFLRDLASEHYTQIDRQRRQDC